MDRAAALARPLPLEHPLAALDALAGLPGAFLFHSSLPGRGARWSLFGADPFATFRGGDWARAVALTRGFAARVEPAGEAPPFTGGLAGYWAYDFGRRFERLREAARDDLGLPDFVAGLYDVVGAFDHDSRRAWAFATGLPHAGAARARRARRRLEAFVRRFERSAARAPGAAADWPPKAAGAPRALASTFDPDGYRRAVRAVIEHIARGDIFQANLSQRWTLPLPEGASSARFGRALSHALARHSPAPHAAHFDAGDHAVASASPERFLALRGRMVETRPIKGTRPRHADPARDRAAARALETSAKDRAENVMIVDVLRNDLGRVCETGSITVPGLCELEEFAQVWHLTSTIHGRLAAAHDAFDLLRACMPGGSISGAPKIRAMEIIDRLEPVRRHIYTGALGWVGWNGDADWSIAIRTALVTADAVRFHAGGAVTADSDPDGEHEETLHKAEGLRQALGTLVGPLALTGAP
ncbi:MAG TPA: anthranilate synthase component I family protein, partial [Candidatus Eisenbacteria bacterium]|nr:anthranilate synthase component I family protein [Candidatus Eisenbacteria bacterium]